MTADLKDFFLASPMDEAEYMRLPLKYFPADIIETYNINNLKEADDYVYIKIKKGMYGLKQAAILAYDHLVKNLKEHGYEPIPHTVGMWKHFTRRTVFCLCVDDFGIKYYTKEDANHLLDALRNTYKVTVDWKGKNYCGLTLAWNYDEGYVDIFMPEYITKVINKYFHNRRLIPTHTPYKIQLPNYKIKTQYVEPPDLAPTLDKTGTTRIQAIVGSLLYYARAIEHTLLPALNEIAAEQAKPTMNTVNKVDNLLMFVATCPNGKLRFHASDMVLHVDSEAAYLVLPNAKSRIAGFFHLVDATPTFINAPILITCKTLKNVVSSAAEAETGGLFINGQETINIRRILQAINHPQQPTPLKTDNSTSEGFVHKNIRLKRSKAWDMRYHWLRDNIARNNLRIFWARGTQNRADYFTKHHTTPVHLKMRPLLFSSP